MRHVAPSFRYTTSDKRKVEYSASLTDFSESIGPCWAVGQAPSLQLSEKRFHFFVAVVFNENPRDFFGDVKKKNVPQPLTPPARPINAPQAHKRPSASTVLGLSS